MYADVIVDISYEKLDRIFQYRIPKELKGRLAVGSRVEIPFGAGNRRISGYVVGFSEYADYPEEKLKRIIRVMENSRRVDEIFPEIRLEWLLCIDNFKTLKEKEDHSKEIWEEHQKVELLHDKAFRLFIDEIEDLCGYGLHSQGTDLLIGDYIAVSDSTGKKIGVIPQESFQKLQSEVENYASYLIQKIIKTEMMPMPGEGKEGIEKWLTSKSAGTNPAN